MDSVIWMYIQSLCLDSVTEELSKKYSVINKYSVFLCISSNAYKKSEDLVIYNFFTLGWIQDFMQASNCCKQIMHLDSAFSRCLFSVIKLSVLCTSSNFSRIHQLLIFINYFFAVKNDHLLDIQYFSHVDLVMLINIS